MSEPQIKLIDEKTDLTNINKPYDWDLVIKDTPYYVCKMNGYYHSIGGRYGNNDLWCYPRNEIPSFENLLQFNGVPVRWGFAIDDNNYTRFKWGEGEVLHNHAVTITRNGENFHTLHSGNLGYCTAKAQVIIREIEEHPMNLIEIDFDKKVIGRKVWWRESPGIIKNYIKGQACVIIEPDGIDRFPKPNCYNNDDLPYAEDIDIKAEIFDKNIWWFR